MIINKNCYNSLFSYQELKIVQDSGRIPLLDIDMRGVLSLKNMNFNAKYIFITSPSLEVLVSLRLILKLID